MGSSPRGLVLYGIQLEREAEQPWDAGHAGDEESWWRDVSGFVNPVECPYDDDGNHKPGYSDGDARITAYWGARREWDKANPFPYDLHRIGYSDDPSFVLALKSTGWSSEWDECQELKPEMLVSYEEWSKHLLEFCQKYGIATHEHPGWWLTSFYG